MGMDIKDRVNQCCKCKKGKLDTGPKKGFLESTRNMKPLEKVFLDYLRPLPWTKTGHRFTDLCSWRWTHLPTLCGLYRERDRLAL